MVEIPAVRNQYDKNREASQQGLSARQNVSEAINFFTDKDDKAIIGEAAIKLVKDMTPKVATKVDTTVGGGEGKTVAPASINEKK